MKQHRNSGWILYSAAVFLGAYLLFLVQPLIAKYILPWFGGSPAVWTTCMLFFQALLLCGYGYAHWLTKVITPKRQPLLHLTLVWLTLLLLPIIPSETWKPLGDHSPTLRILAVLLVSIGAPFFFLSATGPLFQSWFSKIVRDLSAYRLYSYSNLGSLLAILSYPFLIEPNISLDRQALLWSFGYAAFALLCTIIGVRLNRTRTPASNKAEANEPFPEMNQGDQPSIFRHLLWFFLAAIASAMLLATTNQLCQDVAVVPLLWILPFALYLLTFIVCFHHERWYSRPLFFVLLIITSAQTCYFLFEGVSADITLQIISYSSTLFICCMICHGELAKLKPATSYLTTFYLMVAGGGVTGGIFVSLLAPILFKGFWEYHLILFLTGLLFLLVLFTDKKSVLYQGRPAFAWALLYASITALAVTLAIHIRDVKEESVEITRNFFGVLRILEHYKDMPEQHRYILMHGRIEHGYQLTDEKKRYWPTSYFGPEGGAGISILFHHRRFSESYPPEGMRIGVVGLGAGIISTYGEQGDIIRFYEINPEIVRLSSEYFTYQRDSSADVQVVLGDARISMEREQQEGNSQQFDVLIVDAFSSDAIPVHLFTRECFQIYRYHLKNDGILAMHISNRYFDLAPIVRGVKELDGWEGTQALYVSSTGNQVQETNDSEWVLLTRNQHFINSEQVISKLGEWRETTLPPYTWSDDYVDLFNLLIKESP